MTNDEIKQVTSNGEWKTIYWTNGGNYTVPKDAPEIDPYDRSEGGFMAQNSIIDSKLTQNAKMLYCALRRYVCYGTGYISAKQETLAKGMSVSLRTMQDAMNELEECNVIRVKEMRRNGHKKNYYNLMPANEWKLPLEKRKAKTSKVKLKENIVPIEPESSNPQLTGDPTRANDVIEEILKEFEDPDEWDRTRHKRSHSSNSSYASMLDDKLIDMSSLWGEPR